VQVKNQGSAGYQTVGSSTRGQEQGEGEYSMPLFRSWVLCYVGRAGQVPSAENVVWLSGTR